MLEFFRSSFLSFLIVITPLMIIGSVITNKTITNSAGMSETTSSGAIPEFPEVAMISNIMVGTNQTHRPRISQ